MRSLSLKARRSSDFRSLRQLWSSDTRFSYVDFGEVGEVGEVTVIALTDGRSRLGTRRARSRLKTRKTLSPPTRVARR